MKDRRILLAAGAVMVVVTACTGVTMIMEQRRRMMVYVYALYMYWRKGMLDEEMEAEMVTRVLKRKREHK